MVEREKNVSCERDFRFFFGNLFLFYFFSSVGVNPKKKKHKTAPPPIKRRPVGREVSSRRLVAHHGSVTRRRRSPVDTGCVLHENTHTTSRQYQLRKSIKSCFSVLAEREDREGEGVSNYRLTPTDFFPASD